MIRWEFMEMADFRPSSSIDPTTAETDMEKLVVLPGFEEPVNNFITWIQCFCRYMAAMSKQYPECTSGFLSHLLVVLKAFNEVEHPAWREYDEAYHEKMASTGEKVWSGMDVALYQELCASRQKLRTPLTERKEAPKGPGGKWSISGWVMCAGSTTTVSAHTLHANSHMHVRYVGETIRNDSAQGVEK